MKKIKSGEVIGRLLGMEGFSDYTANQIEHYWKNRSGLTERQQKSIKNLRKEFSGIMKNLTKAECLVIGHFIGLKEKMAFDTGLKLGLQTMVQNNDHEIELPAYYVENNNHKKGIRIQDPPCEKIDTRLNYEQIYVGGKIGITCQKCGRQEERQLDMDNSGDVCYAMGMGDMILCIECRELNK